MAIDSVAVALDTARASLDAAACTLRVVSDTLWVATRGSEWAKAGVPALAAFGGASVGALLNWLFNRGLARDNRLHAELMLQQNRRYEALREVRASLTSIFVDLSLLKGYLDVAVSGSISSHVQTYVDSVRATDAASLNEESIKKVVRTVLREVTSDPATAVADRIVAQCDIATKLLISFWTTLPQKGTPPIAAISNASTLANNAKTLVEALCEGALPGAARECDAKREEGVKLIHELSVASKSVLWLTVDPSK
jgi:hypothetical protein